MRRIIPAERLCDLRTGDRGLAPADVAARRAVYGSNHILESGDSAWRVLVGETARDPMIWYLVGIGVLYAALGSHAEAAILLAATLPLIGMDAYLHRRSQASTASLRRQLAASATVWRDGRYHEVAAVELVPGDRVRVATGAAFPADGVIVSDSGSGLQAEESTLTGEAEPAAKVAHVFSTAASPDGYAIADQYWGYAGTRLLTGSAEVVVVFTGRETLYGEIAATATASPRTLTPLQRAIADLVRRLIAVSAVLCIVVAVGRWYQGYAWNDALISAATLAIAALPDEYPVVFTVFIGLGVYRLAQRKALVKRGVAVENIGRVTCICTDKTGTLTEGRLRVEQLLPAVDVAEAELSLLLALASRYATGDPIDQAILDHHAALIPVTATPSPLALFPFTEQRRRETVTVELNGAIVAAAKGAPEVLLAMSTLDAAARAQWLSRVEALAAQGLRVLAAMRWVLPADEAGDEPERDGHFCGLVACMDPLRAGVSAALAECRAASIRVIMVTGDHPATARYLGASMGLGNGTPQVMLGDDLIAGLEHGDPHLLATLDIVARALPAQKLALVQALQSAGEIVAVTGDGVNDVPALQAADVGLAMGERGSRRAHEVAAIILQDDNFTTIVHAIAEGRQLFRNLRLSFAYLLIIHLPLVTTAAVVPLLGYPLLYLPIHIVWIELVIHPTALLVFQDLPPPTALRIAPRSAGPVRFFSPSEWVTIAVAGGLLTVLVMLTFDRALAPTHDVAHARAMALVALTCGSAGLTAVLSRLRHLAAWVMSGGTVALSVVLVQMPLLARWLHLAPLHRDDWALALGGALLCTLVPANAGFVYRFVSNRLRAGLTGRSGS